jgi:hypothetical protein
MESSLLKRSRTFAGAPLARKGNSGLAEDGIGAEGAEDLARY